MVIHINKQNFWVHWTIFVKIRLKYVIFYLMPHFIRNLRGIDGNKKSGINSLHSLTGSTGEPFFDILSAEIEFEIWT